MGRIGCLDITLLSYGLAALGFLALTAVLLASEPARPLRLGLHLAIGTQAFWSLVVALGTISDYPPVLLIQLSELARDVAWLYLLLRALGYQENGEPDRWMGRRWTPVLAASSIAALGVISLRPFVDQLPITIEQAADAALLLWLSLSIVGLLLIEQFYRNARHEERWGIKFLCLGLGSLFAYDLFMYAEGLLFRQLNPQLWQARGLINVLVVPWLAVALLRQRNWRMELRVSRHVVFHTVTLMGAGLYLMGMAAIGYFIKYLGGSWGGVLQIGFLAASGALLCTLLFSGTLRTRLRVFLSKHFFSYRYDYRLEWLRFTEDLSHLGDQVPVGIIRSLASLVQSPGGLLFHRSAGGALEELARWELDAPQDHNLGSLPEWLASSGWVVDLSEWRQSPDLYAGIELPPWLNLSQKIWLVVPLVFQEELEAVLLLARTDLKRSINWEDRDLLRTAGRQAAALLAQQRASIALVEARQFDAFNRLSAYVIHDLKNILAQQSLIVSNAQKHKHNPAFVDDMVSTVENSVRRMQRLMEQMRSGLRSGEAVSIALEGLLGDVVAGRATARPLPLLTIDDSAAINADRERLGTVFSHLLQNAQEATEDNGTVAVRLSAENGFARVEIIDSGCGMSAAFVRERLFKPFDSTKGLTGMGIGAFESREYVRQLGGDIHVVSTPGEGSQFTVTLPLFESVGSPETDLDSLPASQAAH